MASLALGLTAGWIDVRAPWEHESAQLTIVVLLAFTGLLGLVWPRRPWRWGIIVGSMLPLVYLIRHVLGKAESANLNGVGSILLLMVLTVSIGISGSLVGSALSWRRSKTSV